MALNFASAGSARRVDYGTPSSLNNLTSSAMTVAGWARRSSNGTNQHIVTKDQVTTNGWTMLCSNSILEGGFRAVYRRSSGNADSQSSNVVFPLDTWAFFAAVYSFNNATKLYGGGLNTTVTECSYNTQSSGAGTHADDSAASVYVGNLQRSTTLPFLGDIARVGIWDRALSLAELVNIQWNWLPLSGCRLLTDYHGTATQPDYSGNVNSGTVTSATASTSHVPLRNPWMPVRAPNYVNPLPTTPVTIGVSCTPQPVLLKQTSKIFAITRANTAGTATETPDTIVSSSGATGVTTTNLSVQETPPDPVDVVLMIGESNTCGARNNLNEIPSSYYTTDSNAFIWDDAEIGGTGAAIRVLVPGPMEQQPGGAAYVDAAYTNTAGPCGEFIKHYRADNPSKAVYFFVNQQGGGRFSDASSRGRVANYIPTLADGAYNEMKVSWNAFKAALLADNKTPNIIVCRINLGGNSSNDATETSNFQSDLTNFISYVRADMVGNAKITLDRYGASQTGWSANINTIRTAVQNIVLADPTRVELLPIDGMPVVSTLGGPDSVHLTTAAHIAIGEQLYYHAAGLWYPQKEQSFNGGNPVTHEYRPGDYRNVIANSTLTSGDLTTCFDATGAGLSPTQGTSTKRPAVSRSAVSNGYLARYATGDGTDDILTVQTSGAAGISTGSQYGVFVAASVATVANNAVLLGEGYSADLIPFYEPIKMNTGGDLIGLGRNNANTIFLDTTPVLQTGGFNGSMNFLATWGTTTQVTGQVNGSAGTPVSITRGTVSADRFALYGLYYGSGELHYGNGKIGIAWTTASTPDSTYLANARAYCQRRWGTV